MSQPAIQQSLDNNNKYHIFVCGAPSLTTEIICQYLSQTTGFGCASGGWPSLISALRHEFHERPRIVLLDYDAPEVRENLSRELSEVLTAQGDVFAIVFNFSPEQRVKKLLSNGVRGVLYPSDHHLTMVKAVNAVMRGQMWIPRQAMTACLGELCDQPMPVRGHAQALTPREREILSCVASGKTNEEIANSLFISPFTVKVHIQNIFKKIGVPNRVKATIWAQSNLRTIALAVGLAIVGCLHQGTSLA